MQAYFKVAMTATFILKSTFLGRQYIKQCISMTKYSK